MTTKRATTSAIGTSAESDPEFTALDGTRPVRSSLAAAESCSPGRWEPPRGSLSPILVNVRPAFVLALALWALAGCGETGDPAPHPDVTSADAVVRLVDDAEADLVLYASNQSFDDEEVRLTVAVDGVTVVDGDFDVADQHNWVSFPLGMSPGVHEVTATADSGATLRESFRVPGDTTRYAVIEHWGEDDEAELTWSFQRQPVAFA